MGLEFSPIPPGPPQSWEVLKRLIQQIPEHSLGRGSTTDKRFQGHIERLALTEDADCIELMQSRCKTPTPLLVLGVPIDEGFIPNIAFDPVR